MNAMLERNGLVYADTKEAINSVVRGLIDEAQREYIVDRRRERRQSLAILLNVAPIKDEQLGTEFAAVTHDIATRGMSFLHNSPIDAPYLFLRFPEFNDRQALILEVLRQTQIGPFYMIGGKFRPAY
jgi:hypothetical protein